MSQPPSVAIVPVFQIFNNTLRYRYNLGSGEKTLTLDGAKASDNKWHNVTVKRIGNFATLTMHGVGQVSGVYGTHMLLDSDGVIYSGGVPSRFNMKPPYDLRGRLVFLRLYFCVFRHPISCFTAAFMPNVNLCWMLWCGPWGL